MSSVSSSVPATPDASPSDLGSPLCSPTAVTESFSTPSRDSDEARSLVRNSLFTSMDSYGVSDIASSLALPSISKDETNHSDGNTSAFTLDPLHFESLQFDSDAFP